MNRLSLHGHRGFAHDLGEARVGVHGHPDLLRRAFDELGEDALGYEVRNLGAYGVHAEDEVGLGVGHYLEEAVGLTLDQSFTDGPEGELGLVDLVALLLGLRLVEPEGGNLGAAEGNARDEVPVLGQRVLAGHVLDGDDALVPGLVGEPETPYHVAGGVHAVLGGGRVFAAVTAALALGLLLFARARARDLDLDAVVGLLQAIRISLGAG